MSNFSPRQWVPAACLLVSAVCAPPTNAAVIAVSSASNTLNIGQDFNVNFGISGLSSASNDSLSAFDLDIRFDPASMQLNGFGFNDSRSARNQLDIVESGSFGFLGAALVNGEVIDAYGLSGNSAAVLDADQADTFTFLTLYFTATAATPLSTVAIDLNDPTQLFVNSQAEKLEATIGVSAANFSIAGPMQPVPEPGALALFASGILMLVALGRRPFNRTRAIIPVAATAIAAIVSIQPAAAQPSARDTVRQSAPANGDAINGVILDIQGQRLLLALPGGATRWVTVRMPPGKDQIGKKVSGVAVPRGDTYELRDPKLND